jgi:hypothetical protein
MDGKADIIPSVTAAGKNLRHHMAFGRMSQPHRNAALTASVILHPLLQCLIQTHNLSGILHRQLALWGQLHSALDSLDESAAVLLFKHMNVLRHSRLGEPKKLSCPCVIFGFAEGDQSFQLIIHGMILSEIKILYIVIELLYVKNRLRQKIILISLVKILLTK